MVQGTGKNLIVYTDMSQVQEEGINQVCVSRMSAALPVWITFDNHKP